jgi:hypothetical protein
MSFFDYKVVPAPRKAKRVKGVRAGEELFALTLTDAINEQSRQGWEYVRAESLPAETPGGWFRKTVAPDQTGRVFRRPREQLGPRLAPVATEPVAAAHDAGEATRVPAERPLSDRIVGVTRRDVPGRREPLILEAEDVVTPAPTPLRPSPRLGPAEGN